MVQNCFLEVFLMNFHLCEMLATVTHSQSFFSLVEARREPLRDITNLVNTRVDEVKGLNIILKKKQQTPILEKLTVDEIKELDKINYEKRKEKLMSSRRSLKRL